MSFLKSLFGLGKSEAGGSSPGAAKVVKEIEHKGFTVRATPFAEGGQFQTAGAIVKMVDGVEREHRFIRADRFASLDAAADVALAKGRQIIDERGERIFAREE